MVEKFREDSLDLEEYISHNIKSSKPKGLLKCVQCGMCTSVCPAAQHSNYNPRSMVECVLEGDTAVIEDEDIWYCFYCYTCHSICPADNSPCEVNQVLRQIAVDKGIADDHLIPFLGFGDSFLNHGIGGIPENFFPEMKEDIGDDWWDFKTHLDDVRNHLGLDPVFPSEEAIVEVSTILKSCGFEDRINKIRNHHKDED
ncbi:heterodisulfide reductase subunit C [Methanobrevibacter sp. 87.7]|uniref:ferredoxin:CoB-CoM heterodisulfide reductase subunit HdrC n=1 Tax=Methanobrevibacter sp. 87.7 TaxID=387957 RepID=UPI000B513304|nr:ferredoxin:CoB-CoM heterodisulfide reductase subunit HdrC [Methanobrevibacter sp. 87.7]OWT33856.1 heterodisulfide reductase subunit C [Methanobrevibacter sp. 87.7]